MKHCIQNVIESIIIIIIMSMFYKIKFIPWNKYGLYYFIVNI